VGALAVLLPAGCSANPAVSNQTWPRCRRLCKPAWFCWRACSLHSHALVLFFRVGVAHW